MKIHLRNESMVCDAELIHSVAKCLRKEDLGAELTKGDEEYELDWRAHGVCDDNLLE